MTTIVAALTPWLPILPVDGVALIADTRSTTSGSEPFDLTWKVRPLGKFALGAVAGSGFLGKAILEKLAGYFQRNATPLPGPITEGRILQLIHQGAAGARRPFKKKRVKLYSDDYQVAVAHVTSEGQYEIRFYNEKGLQLAMLQEQRGPYLFGSGIVQVAAGAAEPNVDEFANELEANFQKASVNLLSHPDRLTNFSHLLAVSFHNSFIREGSDPATGGYVQMSTLHKSRGVRDYQLWEYDLPAGAEVGEGTWLQRTPPVLLEKKPSTIPTAGRFGRTGDIAGLFVDHQERLFVLAETRAQTGFLGPPVPEEQVPITARNAVEELKRSGRL